MVYVEVAYRLHSHLEINFKANKQSTLKRTKSFIQSSLDDLVYEPGNLFQGGRIRLTQEINFPYNLGSTASLSKANTPNTHS